MPETGVLRETGGHAVVAVSCANPETCLEQVSEDVVAAKRCFISARNVWSSSRTSFTSSSITSWAFGSMA
jgi:hypothetical protein